MKTIKQGETKNLDLSGQTISGFRFAFYVTHGTANTPFAANPINFDNIICQLNLKRKLKSGLMDEQIINDRASMLFSESSYKSAGFQPIIGTFLAGSTMRILTAAGVGIKEVLLVTGYIDLGGVINVASEDSCIFTYKLNTGTFSSAVEDATSFCEFDSISAIGLEYYTPKIQVYSIEGGSSNDKVPTGDGLVSAVFINTDKLSNTSSNTVVTGATFNSDKFSIDYDYYTLQTQRDRLFELTTTASLRCQCFPIVAFDTPMNSSSINLNMNGANVVTSKNAVVYRTQIYNKDIFERAMSKKAKHDQSNFSFLK